MPAGLATLLVGLSGRRSPVRPRRVAARVPRAGPLDEPAGDPGDDPRNDSRRSALSLRGRGLAETWRQRLAHYRASKSASAGREIRKYFADHLRSIPLRHFAPLASVPGVRLISLQKGAGAEQFAAAAADFPVVDFGPDFDAKAGTFMDTAAVMRNLDLVITSDTAVAHLAGALGVPVWVALLLVRLAVAGRAGRQPLVSHDAALPPGEAGGLGGRIYEDCGRTGPACAWRAAGDDRFAAGQRAGDSGTAFGRRTSGPDHDLEGQASEIGDDAARRNVERELRALLAVERQADSCMAALDALFCELQVVNETLWLIEDEIRDCEARGDFGPRFVELRGQSTTITIAARRSSAASMKRRGPRSSRRSSTVRKRTLRRARDDD